MDKLKIKMIADETLINYGRLLEFFLRKRNNLTATELKRVKASVSTIKTDVDNQHKRIDTLILLETL